MYPSRNTLLSSLPLLLSLLASSSSSVVNAQTSSATATTTTTAAVATAVQPDTSDVGTATGVIAITSINTSLPQTAVTNLPYSAYIPNLSLINDAETSTLSTVPLAASPTAGATVTGIPGAPVLPSIVDLNPANYPTLDVTPPTNSTEVLQWISEIDWTGLPNASITTGVCSTDPDAVATAGADGYCWWTCGTCTRESDITVCPDKYDWGVSYDDGPSPWTPLLLDYLNQENISSTFFIVGSRAISRPAMVQAEYTTGHMLSVHTWSHPYLTIKTNEQIVAELGWTKKILKDITGVTPNTFRPPYGDIDDRVRYIAAQMGLTPIIWTKSNGIVFDTSDWDIPAGTATGESALGKFETILEQANVMDTGFIVLEHDLWPQTVELAVGYILPYALNQTQFTLQSISECLGWSLADAYIETSDNSTNWSNPEASSTGTSFSVVRGTAAAEAAVSTSVYTTTSGGSTIVVTSGASTATATASTTSTTTTTKSSGGVVALSSGSAIRGLLALCGVALGAILLL